MPPNLAQWFYSGDSQSALFGTYFGGHLIRSVPCPDIEPSSCVVCPRIFRDLTVSLLKFLLIQDISNRHIWLIEVKFLAPFDASTSALVWRCHKGPGSWPSFGHCANAIKAVISTPQIFRSQASHASHAWNIHYICLPSSSAHSTATPHLIRLGPRKRTANMAARRNAYNLWWSCGTAPLFPTKVPVSIVSGPGRDYWCRRGHIYSFFQETLR